MMQGKKVWFDKEALVEFGMKHCLLTDKEADGFYVECENALKETIVEIERYIVKNPHFTTIGRRMVESFKISLKNQTIKELPLELIRTWQYC
jgi:serine/threonine-protein kinase HipA